MARLTVLFLCALMAGNAPADEGQIPEPFVAEYALYSKGFEVAHIERSLKPSSGDTYIYESRSRTVGMLAMFRDDRVVERSQWQTSDAGFQPVHYSYRHKGSKKNRDVQMDFDWPERRVSMNINDDKWQMELESGTLDKMLYQLAIMRDLEDGKRDIRYRVADGGKIKNYRFDIKEHESVQTPYGDFNALKVTRIREDRDRETILWCVEELGYLPVKVVHIEPDGLKTTALLKSYKSVDEAGQSATAVEDAN